MDAASLGTVLDTLTLSHGFRPTPAGPIGVRHGLPVRVAEEKSAERNNQKVLRVVVGTADEDSAAAAAGAVKERRKQLPAKVLGVQPTWGGIVVDLPRKLASAPPDEALEAIDAVLQTVAMVPGSAPQQTDGSHLTTVDGVPMFLTAEEREALTSEARQYAEAYAAIRPNLLGGLLAGAGGALVLALVWAALLAYAGYQLWLVAIGGGLLVAWLAVYVGRRVVLPLQVGIFVLTLLGVLLGEVLGLALMIQREFGFFSLAVAIEEYAAYVEFDPGGALFALGGGLIGAYFGIRKARKPSFDRQIDVH